MRFQSLGLHEMQLYHIIVTVITPHVINNLLAPKWSPALSESAVYAELVLL